MLSVLLAAALGHGSLPGGLAVTPTAEGWTVTWRCPDALSGHTHVVWPDTCAASAPTRGRDEDLAMAITTWTLRCPASPEVDVRGLGLDDPPVVRRDARGVTLLHPAAAPPHSESSACASAPTSRAAWVFGLAAALLARRRDAPRHPQALVAPPAGANL